MPHTGRIKTLAITKNSSSYFLADSKNDTLQRVYGISFPDSKLMTEHKKFVEEAEKRDHRKIGKQQELFMFHELSPGSAFFLPMGMRIYNTLMEFIRVSCGSGHVRKRLGADEMALATHRANTINVAMSRWVRPTFTTRNSGRPRVTGKTMPTTCSACRSTRRNSRSSR